MKMQLLILEMSPQEARSRLQIYTGFDLERLKELLYYRAASDDPEDLMREALSHRVTEDAAYAGLFRSWVRKDPEAALQSAEATERRLQPICIKSWAELDPAGAQRVHQRTERRARR